MFPNDSDLEAMFTFETGATPIDEEPPFHILVLGDWSGHGAKKSLSERRPILIDRDNFDDVLDKLGVSLNLDTSSDGNNLLKLDFNELDDFHPDQIFRQISLFSDLRNIRRQLLNPDTFNQAAREVRSWFNTSDLPEPQNESSSQSSSDPSEAPEAPDNLLDQILFQSEGGASASRSQYTENKELNNLLGDLVKPFLVQTDEEEQSKLVAAVDEATSDLMRKILHHPQFQALEAAWRGLYFLIRQVETDVDLKISILDITKEELADNLKSVNDLGDSQIYKWLVQETVETVDPKPWAVICGNYAFSPNVDDTATLMRIAQIASLANSPFISHIRPEVLGITSLAENPGPEKWDLSVDSTHGKLWTMLRSLPESEYLGFSIPRFLVRLPYGSDTEPLDNFDLEEFAETPVHDQYLWSNPCFINALLLANSYRVNGWEMSRLMQDVEGLPIHIYKDNGETITKPCAEVVMTVNACEKMLEFGLMPLISFRDTDRVRLARHQSISDPLKALKGRWG